MDNDLARYLCTEGKYGTKKNETPEDVKNDIVARLDPAKCTNEYKEILKSEYDKAKRVYDEDQKAKRARRKKFDEEHPKVLEHVKLLKQQKRNKGNANKLGSKRAKMALEMSYGMVQVVDDVLADAKARIMEKFHECIIKLADNPGKAAGGGLSEKNHNMCN